MRHVKRGRKLKRTESHRKALLRNLASSLIRSDQKAIRTTLAKAKELRPYVERLITKARRAYLRERSGQSPYGTTDLHYRRLVAREIPHEAVLQELFDVVAPVVAERNGGYTRIVKLGFRRGDGAQEAIIQLVDWAAPQDGATSLQRKRRTQVKRHARGAATETAAAEAPQQATEQSVSVEAPAAEPSDQLAVSDDTTSAPEQTGNAESRASDQQQPS
ncbi:MAG: 50S ribosomal protein L17 [Chlorobi bacterium]|nr:50S ribosomal protein L17 [Chlorobiota bacterium]